MNENRTEVLMRNTEMFGSRITARASEMLLGWETSHANTIAWSYDVEGHAKKCVERIVQGMIRTLKSSSACHFGSSHVLFERAHGFPASRASLVMSCPTVYNTFWCFPIALMSLLRMHDDATDKELLARPSW